MLDICIKNPDGDEVEPQDTVKVSIVKKSIPADVDINDVVDTTVVQHLNESSGELVVETVATADSTGRIDFDAPPEGYRYTAMPIEYSMVRDWHLDPMFVTRHRIGTEEMLCYMELVETKASLKIEQPYKTENTKETRRRRCRITSEKTGKEIMCPYDGQHVCAGCKKAEDFDRYNSVPLICHLLPLFQSESIFPPIYLSTIMS